MQQSALERLKRLDDERPSLPGEHWVTLGVGLWLMTRPTSTVFGRLAALAGGAALVYRAASGRDGFASRLGWDGLVGSAGNVALRPRYVDLASWPDARRVRVAAISQPVGKTMWTP